MMSRCATSLIPARLLVVALCLLGQALGDTPANCSYDSVKGHWTFYVGPGGGDNSIDCGKDFNIAEKVTVSLQYPDVAATAEDDNGFWTMIYNQGFEVVVGGRKFFAFSNYTVLDEDEDKAISHCHSTCNGWVHDISGKDWACYYGVKDSHGTPSDIEDANCFKKALPLDLDRKYVKNLDFVEQINDATDLWRATHYEGLEGMTLRDRRKMGSFTSSKDAGVHVRSGVNEGNWFSRFYFQQRKEPGYRPERKERFSRVYTPEFDWRDRNGVNYMPPVTNQGKCGSCYAVATANMLHARFKIHSNGIVNKFFAPQEVLSCSEYAQGCKGGFPYLIHKYAEDFGLIEEGCYPYTASHEDKCSPKIEDCPRYFVTDYKYIGGYYGGVNADDMLEELVRNGPIAVGILVEADFPMYSEGIYKHTGVQDEYNLWEPVSHAVVICGYGEDNGVKYWIVQNSWGKDWGENGYFRIARGVNEVNIETLATAATPVL